MDELIDKKQLIIDTYLIIAAATKTHPTYSDYMQYGISRENIRSRFGGIEKLHKYISDHHSLELSEIYVSLGHVFSDDRSVDKSSKKTYIITTAVADSSPHDGFLSAMNNYSEKHDAQIVIMPCESKTNSFDTNTAVFANVFSDPRYLFVSKDTDLNANISLCSIQVSAKQIRPITGLSRIGNREGSFIFASTKQFLEFVPSGNKRGTNYSIMTTGACTLPQYYTDNFVSKRLSYIAERDHIIGAVIVEIEDDEVFHFRQVQADDAGAFIDLGIQYNPDGSTEQVATHLILGDLHSANVDMDVLNAVIRTTSNMKIGKIFLHDCFDGYSINHHVTTAVEKSMRALTGMADLEQELRETFETIKYLDDNLRADEIVIVKSNHDEFLDRYLREGRYINDPVNHYTSLFLARALFEKTDVLMHGLHSANGSIPAHWTFLSRDSSCKIGGVECGAHGDLGLNGAKPSLSSLEKVYGNCVVGHSHTAAIHRGVFRVGVTCKLDLGYNKGPSSWTRTSCLLYENGQRQLINVINGKCSTRDLQNDIPR